MTQKKSNELDIQALIDTNYIVLILLGIASSVMIDMRCALGKDGLSDRNEKFYDWFFDAMEHVIYLKKPPPPIPR